MFDKLFKRRDAEPEAAEAQPVDDREAEDEEAGRRRRRDEDAAMGATAASQAAQTTINVNM